MIISLIIKNKYKKLASYYHMRHKCLWADIIEMLCIESTYSDYSSIDELKRSTIVDSDIVNNCYACHFSSLIYYNSKYNHIHCGNCIFDTSCNTDCLDGLYDELQKEYAFINMDKCIELAEKIRGYPLKKCYR